jgi:hypothetical protein
MLTIYAAVVLGTYAEVTTDDYHNLNENTLDYFDKLHRRITYESGKKFFYFRLLYEYSHALLRKVLESVRRDDGPVAGLVR